MSLRQRVSLELEDGKEVEVVYDGRDLRAWESKYRKSALVEPMGIGMLTWLGWHAAERQGVLNGKHDTWEKFDAACVSVQGLPDKETDGEENPPETKARTRKRAGDDSSAP